MTSSSIFVDDTTVMLAAPRDDAEIRYTLDGTQPTRRSPLYHGLSVSIAGPDQPREAMPPRLLSTPAAP